MNADMKQCDERQAAADSRSVTGHVDMRQGDSWARFLARNRLASIVDAGGATWIVASTSGHTYTVRERTRMDEMGSYSQLWRCNCPARKYDIDGSKSCRHVVAVIDMLADEALANEDYDALNEIVG